MPTSTPLKFFTILLLAVSAPTQAEPPARERADEYATQLMDEANPQRHMAASRLKAVSARTSIPADVERRLADYLRQAPTEDLERAAMIGQAAQVLGTSHADSAALGEVIDALTVALHKQSLPVPRRDSADALYMLARHSSLPATTLETIEDRAFHDTDRKVRIGAMRAMIEAGPDDETRQRLHRVLMEQARLSDNEFAAPESWNYGIGGDHNAITMLLWSLHEPDVPEDVLELWVSKLGSGYRHESAYHMLDRAVKEGPLPDSIYQGLLAVAEKESRMLDARRREEIYRLLQRSRAGSAEAGSEVIDDLALARTFALATETGKRRTAGHLLREFANTNPLQTESLDLLAGIGASEEDRELRELALRVLGYAAAEPYVEVLHGYFNTGRYDHLVLQMFLAGYGREAWVRRYAADQKLHPRFRSAAIYDYSRSGYEVPKDVIALLQDIARDDPEYDVRQGAGQSLRHLNSWVPLQARLERQENQLHVLFMVWLGLVAGYLLSGVVAVFFLVVRWGRIRERFSGVAIAGWFGVAVLLVPAVGFGALSMVRHNGPTPTSEEMFLTFLPTYVLAAYFIYTAVQIMRAGLGPRRLPAPGAVSAI